MRKWTIVYLAGGLLLCLYRWADLALWTDLETGLVTAGAVWQRYAVLAIFVAAALLLAWRGGWEAASLAWPRRRAATAALTVSAWAAAALMLLQAVGSILRAAGPASLGQGVLAFLSALWLGMLGQYWLLTGLDSPRKPSAPPPVWLGVAGSLVFVWGVLADFMTNGSSWQRTVPTSAIWQQLAALVFLTALLRTLCLPGEPNPKAGGRGGLLAYCLCFCWQLPRCVLLGGGAAEWVLCAVGLLGAVCAVLAARGERRPRGAHAMR